MKRWLLAMVVLLAVSVASTWADYVVIIVEPGKKSEDTTTQPGQPGMIPPGMGPKGGPGGRGGMPPMGGGAMGNPQPQPAPEKTEKKGPIDFDAEPTHAVAVVEINEKFTEAQWKAFKNGKPLTISGRFGKATLLPTLGASKEIQIHLVHTKPHTAIQEVYQDLEATTVTTGTKDNPIKADPTLVLAFADWCLKHGYFTTFLEKMDEFAKDQPKHPAAVAYLQVKKDLGKTTTPPKASALRDGLLREYRAVNNSVSTHYTGYHKSPSDEPAEVISRLRILERMFQTYYYWFALRGAALPVPTERQPAIVTFKDDEFRHLQKELNSSPPVTDSFVAQREGVLVMSSKRMDRQYLDLEREANMYWSKGVNRSDVLTNAAKAFKTEYRTEPYAQYSLEALALVQLTMEKDAERAGVSHTGSRLMLYVSNQLPRGVVAPEWVGFGVGSFFETPVRSPYISTGGANSHYLPLWRDLKTEKHFKSATHPDFDAAETLRMVVTDGFFRQAQLDRTRSSRIKAETASWALMYYLAKGNNKLDGAKPTLDGLQRYMKELSKMPRDMELDEDLLLACFCKSFGLMDPTYSGDLSKSAKFQAFATTWVTFLEQERLDLEDIVNGVHDVVTKFAVEGDQKTVFADGPLTGPFHPDTGSTGGSGGTKPGAGGKDYGRPGGTPPMPNGGPGGTKPPPQRPGYPR